MIKNKKALLLLTISIIWFSIGVIISAIFMKHSNNQVQYIYKNDYVQSIVARDIIDNVEQKDINNTDYSYEMNKLDEFLPLAAKESNLEVKDFRKQELKGGIYYYEYIRSDAIFYFELDKMQSNPIYTTYSLYKILKDSSIDSDNIMIISFGYMINKSGIKS